MTNLINYKDNQHVVDYYSGGMWLLRVIRGWSLLQPAAILILYIQKFGGESKLMVWGCRKITIISLITINNHPHVTGQATHALSSESTVVKSKEYIQRRRRSPS